MCFGICWTEDIGRFFKTFIKSKMHLASPTPSCVVNDFGTPTLLLYSQSHLLFSDGAKLIVISIHRCEQTPMLPEPQGTCVHRVKRGISFSLQTILPCLILCSLLEPYLFPVRDKRSDQWSPRWSWPPIQAHKFQKLELGWLCWFLHVTVEYRSLSVPLDPCSQVCARLS